MMKVKQVSVFLENRSGRLKEMTGVLGEGNVNIRALSIADTAEFGIVRLVVDKPNEAARMLGDAGFGVQVTELVAVEVEDVPGGLDHVLDNLVQKDINIDYLYCFLGKSSGEAIVMIRVDKIDQAIDALKTGGCKLIPEDELYSL